MRNNMRGIVRERGWKERYRWLKKRDGWMDGETVKDRLMNIKNFSTK